jgi:hypothetical protein
MDPNNVLLCSHRYWVVSASQRTNSTVDSQLQLTAFADPGDIPWSRIAQKTPCNVMFTGRGIARAPS